MGSFSLIGKKLLTAKNAKKFREGREEMLGQRSRLKVEVYVRLRCGSLG